jgi:PadR family transcriptional regulator, regulatory protein PadR
VLDWYGDLLEEKTHAMIPPCLSYSTTASPRKHVGILTFQGLMPRISRHPEESVTQAKADLLQGTLDLLVLKALSLGPLHGYGIVQRIRQLSGEMLTVEQGSLYPALYRIEQHGWVSSRWVKNETGRRAKFYTLTKSGRKRLSAEEKSWDLLAMAIARVMQAS